MPMATAGPPLAPPPVPAPDDPSVELPPDGFTLEPPSEALPSTCPTQPARVAESVPNSQRVVRNRIEELRRRCRSTPEAARFTGTTRHSGWEASDPAPPLARTLYYVENGRARPRISLRANSATAR